MSSNVGQLTPTEAEGIRFCSPCNREVFLVLTEEAFTEHRTRGGCVAVPLGADDAQENGHFVGGEGKPYPYGGKMGPEKVCRWGHRWDQA